MPSGGMASPFSFLAVGAPGLFAAVRLSRHARGAPDDKSELRDPMGDRSAKPSIQSEQPVRVLPLPLPNSQGSSTISLTVSHVLMPGRNCGLGRICGACSGQT